MLLRTGEARSNLDVLGTVGIDHEMASDAGVGASTLTSFDVPGVTHHEFEVVVLIDRRAHIGVIVAELFKGHLVVSGLAVPLAHELSQDFILALFAGLELRVEGHIVGLGEIIETDHSRVVLVELGEGHLHETDSPCVHLSADTTEELIEGYTAIVVFVEVLKDPLELRWAQFVAIFTETPHEFIPVKFLVTVIIHAAEDVAESTDTVSTACLKHVTDLSEDLKRRLTLNAEGRVYIGIVATSTDGEHGCEFFIIEATVSVFIVGTEDSV